MKRWRGLTSRPHRWRDGSSRRRGAGYPTGVIFIPPHLVQEVVEASEAIRVRDEFGKMRLGEGKYTSGEIDVGTWREDIEADFQTWLLRKTNNK